MMLVDVDTTNEPVVKGNSVSLSAVFWVLAVGALGMAIVLIVLKMMGLVK